MSDVRSKPSSCSGCPLESHGSDFSAVEGRGSLGVMVCAEASGEGEARDLLPLRPYMPSGSIYERTIRRLGYSRESFATTNACRCRPNSNLLEGMPFEQLALDHCRSNLLAAVAKFRPRVIVAMGNIALKSTTGLYGPKLGISHLRGYVIRAAADLCVAAGNPDLVVVPTFHPAFLRRGQIGLSGTYARDIQRSVNIARGKDRSFILEPPEDPANWEYDPETNPDPWDENYEEVTAKKELDSSTHIERWMKQYGLRYILKPTPADLDRFCRDVRARSDAWLALSPDLRRASSLALSADIETQESASLDEDATDGYTDTIINQVQFSIEPAQGISLDWTDENQLAARWLLRLPLPKVGHNWWLFDQKVLRAVGIRSHGSDYFRSSGDTFDTLQMFHHWQPDIPAHLQFAGSFVQFPFPWKHLAGSNLPFYGCCDTDATLRIFATVKKTMIDRGIWDDSDLQRAACGYLNQTQALRPILAAMEDRGLPVDDARRLALDKEFDLAASEVFLELNQKFPDEARKVSPKEGHKGAPPRVKQLLLAGVQPIEVKSTIFAMPAKKTRKGEKPGEFFHFELRHISQDGTLPPRWFKIFDFSPNSSQQIIRYMRVKKHKVPSKKGGGDTSEKKELERLAAKHSDSFYFKVIEYRELTKMRGTYIDGYRPHADGCVHTTFTFAPATQQTSSRNPNVQNAPARSKLADVFRGIIRHPEKLVVEWDYKSFHVLTTGFEAKSPEYMRLARLDMHSFIAWHFLKLPGADQLYYLPDEELAEKLEWFKSDKARKYVRDKQAKPAILGIGFGLGDEKFYNMNLEHFRDKKEASTLRSLIKSIFPRVFTWQDEIRELAHQQTYLKGRYGAIRWFYEVKVPDSKGGMKSGEQSEQAIAFLPASDAFGHIRCAMRELDRQGLAQKWNMVNTVHDSLVLLVHPDRMEEHVADVFPVLSAPSNVLIDAELAPSGLACGVECSAGVSWAKSDLKDIPLPKLVLA
jgi:uracil-DNA glycosylase family 4